MRSLLHLSIKILSNPPDIQIYLQTRSNNTKKDNNL